MSDSGGPEQISTNPFVYDVSDLRALNWQTTRWWHLLPSIVIFGALVWFFGTLMSQEGFDWILVGILLLIVSLAVGPWTWRPLLMLRSLRRQGLLQPMTISIAPDYLIVCAARGDARLKWSGIRTVTRKADRLFLFSSKRVAHIIPRRAFDSGGDFEAFVTAAQVRWEQSHRL